MTIPFASRTALLLPTLLLLLGTGGCTVYVTRNEAVAETAPPQEAAAAGETAEPESSSPPPESPAGGNGDEEMAGFTLRDLLSAARRNMLEIQTIESLQELAGEHVGNARLLQIPGFIDELRTTVRKYETDRDPRLKLLDDAIAYNDLLHLPAGVDMAGHRRRRAGELLDYQVAALASRFAAARDRFKLAPDDATRRKLENLALELRVLTGLYAEEIDEFNPASLATPFAPPETADTLYVIASERRSETAGLPITAESVHALRRRYRDDAAAEAMLADALYRLPRRLAGHSLREQAGYAMHTVHLANALGTAFEADLDHRTLSAAWKRVRHARLKLELHPGDRKSRFELIDATLAWRLAWYRLLTDLAAPLTGKLPAPSASAAKPLPPGTLDLLCR